MTESELNNVSTPNVSYIPPGPLEYAITGELTLCRILLTTLKSLRSSSLNSNSILAGSIDPLSNSTSQKARSETPNKLSPGIGSDGLFL